MRVEEAGCWSCRVFEDSHSGSEMRAELRDVEDSHAQRYGVRAGAAR